MKLKIMSDEWWPSLRHSKLSESTFSIVCIGLGMAVAGTLAPWNIYFVPNFFYYWLPQALVFGLLLLVGSRPAAIAGSALALAVFLGMYGAWIFYRRDTSGLAWLGYLSAIPGAMVGAFGSKLLVKSSFNLVAAACISFGLTALGILASLAFMCTTFMRC